MEEISIRPARFDDPDVAKIVAEALNDLAGRYGGSGDDTPIDPRDFDPPNGAFFVAVLDGRLIGCAGWRLHGTDAELKRMYTAPAARGRGLARRMLTVIEDSARAVGLTRVILETGDQQPEAIGLYESAGYRRIENFGYYKDHENAMSYGRSL